MTSQNQSKWFKHPVDIESMAWQQCLIQKEAHGQRFWEQKEIPD